MTSNSRPRPQVALLATMLLLAAPGRARGQSLRVRVTEEQTRRPLAGAIVDVLDTANVVVSQGVLSAEGRRVMPLGAPGGYHVRVRRIGYAPFVGPTVRVTGTEAVDVALRAPDRRIVLAAIDVRATNTRCGSRCARRSPPRY
jgi:hypothetical protein